MISFVVWIERGQYHIFLGAKGSPGDETGPSPWVSWLCTVNLLGLFASDGFKAGLVLQDLRSPFV